MERAKNCMIIAEFSEHTYTGANIHAWSLAEVLSASGTGVIFYANRPPIFLSDFKHHPAHNDILILEDEKYGCEIEVSRAIDFILLAPNLKPSMRIYSAAVRLSRRFKAPLVFLDYESPHWFNNSGVGHRPIWRTLPWFLTARHSHFILSSTNLGSSYAKHYYQPIIDDDCFQVCAPPINSVTADSINSQKRDSIVCFVRGNKHSLHKRTDRLEDLICEAAGGSRIIVIGELQAYEEKQLQHKAQKLGINLQVKTRISEEEKFQNLKKAQVLVYLSEFEGFGYPPAEALYCGARCIANPLPVFQENFSNYLDYISSYSAKNLSLAISKCLTDSGRTLEAKEKMRELVSFDSCVKRITRLSEEWTNKGKKESLPRRSSIEMALFRLLSATLIGIENFVLNLFKKPL